MSIRLARRKVPGDLPSDFIGSGEALDAQTLAQAAEQAGPLFQHPTDPSYLWIAALVVSLPAAAVACWGLVRGSLSAGAASAGLILLPAFAFLLANLVVMQESKSVAFCGSCHVTMAPITESAFVDNGSLASQHFRAGAVPSSQGCYACHRGYGIWGGLDAKIAGVYHMLHTVTGSYDYPIRMAGTFDIGSCLGCHAESASFRAEVAHQNPRLQADLLSGKRGCANGCHAAAHPAEVLTGAGSR